MWPALLGIGWIISIGMVWYAVRKTRSPLARERIPLMALLGAGIFVAQMLNFPVGGGTTGHLVGAALATIMLGFAPALLVLALILIVQALMFGDGGVTALGLNILNMAVIGCGVSQLIYGRLTSSVRRPAIIAAAWAAVFVGALACAIELGASYWASGGSYGIPMTVALPSMLGYHALIGAGEGILTAGIIAYLHQLLPEVFTSPGRQLA
jgi:cobalt/nickel transport system permease protein